MTTVLIVILVIVLIGAFPTWPYAANWGYYPSGAVGIVLLILVILLLTGEADVTGDEVVAELRRLRPMAGGALWNEITALGERIRADQLAPEEVSGVVTFEDVDAERDRRNNRGQQLTLKSGKIVYMATETRADFDNINFSADTALSLIAKTIPALKAAMEAILPEPHGPAPTYMEFRDFYRRPTQVTYHEMVEIQVRITDNIVAVNKASHLLKDMDPIPPDYTDDKYWPTIPLPPVSPP